MLLRAILTLGMVGLALGVWVETWSAVRAKSRAEREWNRVTGTVFGLGNPLRPDVKVEQGIEFVPTDGFYSPSSDERVLEMESDEGLRRWRRYEFLVDPVTKRARVAGLRFSPFLLALLGLVYLVLAAAFYYVTSNNLTHHGVALPVSPPGEWVHFQAPPWHEAAVVSARSGVWPAFEYWLGTAVLVFTFVMTTWRSSEGRLLWRVGASSVMLFAAGVFAVYALHRTTYRIDADSTGLRESSALCWRVTPWPVLRGAVDETAQRILGRMGSGRGSSTMYRTTHRVYFTDDQGEEVVSFDDDNLGSEQAKALVAHVLARTGLHPKKSVLGKKK